MPRIVPIVLAVALWIYAIIDCARTDSTQMPGRLKKGPWLALVIFLPIIGSAIWLYLAWKMSHPNGIEDSAISFGGNSASRPRGPVAPDDDPEFLARLDAENRFREWERQQKENHGKEGDDASSPSA